MVVLPDNALRPRRRSLTVAALWMALGGLAVAPPAGALPETPTPVISLHHVVRTDPFAGSRRHTIDNEGSAYVARDHSLWVADDDGERLLEVSTRTGKLKRTINAKSLAGVRRMNGGRVAGGNRVGDLESLAYNPRSDKLFAFSGSCCSPSARPTVFRLTRNGRGNLHLDSFQSLPAGSDFTASAWNPADRRLYLGADTQLWVYRYAANAVGPAVSVPGLSDVLGMTFTRDGRSLFVARSPAVLSRIDWATLTLVPGWTFDLAPYGMVDARAVELVEGRLWVSDGYDLRPEGDPLSHAVFVFDVLAP